MALHDPESQNSNLSCASIVARLSDYRQGNISMPDEGSISSHAVGISHQVALTKWCVGCLIRDFCIPSAKLERPHATCCSSPKKHIASVRGDPLAGSGRESLAKPGLEQELKKRMRLGNGGPRRIRTGAPAARKTREQQPARSIIDNPSAFS